MSTRQPHKTYWRRGPLHGRAKLTAAQVREMRRMYDARTKGTATYRQLAAAFGVTTSTVERVIHRLVYKDV